MNTSERSGYTGVGGGLSGVVDDSTLFGQTMGLVALTAGLFAAGAYLGRSLSYGLGFVFFIAAFGCLITMRYAVRRSGGSAIGLLFLFGLLMGLATAPTLAYYAARIRKCSGKQAVRPHCLWSCSVRRVTRADVICPPSAVSACRGTRPRSSCWVSS